MNNLPTSTCFRHSAVKQIAANFSENISSTHKNNFNLSEAHKELLRWHYRLGHIGTRVIQFILRTGALSSSDRQRRLHTRAANIQSHDLPKCGSCMFGKQTRKRVPGKVVSRVVKDREGILSADKTVPGQLVFLDHFICSTRGRMIKGYGIRGRSKTNSYCGGCIMVDASSGYIHVECQTSTSSHYTLEALDTFEKMAYDNGIIIQKYQSDNGSSFTSKEFRTRLEDQGQEAMYSGAGSHHQNGTAERAIRTIMAMARTMLLHSATHWPDVAADPTTWPLAVRHAVYIYNRMPSTKTGLSPMDLWSRTRFPMQKLLSLHVWGCPVYVLEKNLADGKSIGRWKAKSQRMVYMGYSDKHASDVPLVLNPFTGSITPQWNVVIDDWFATVATSVDDLPDFSADVWSTIFGAHTYHFPLEPGEELENDLPKQKSNIVKEEHPKFEEQPSYTPPTNVPQGNSWINAPQLPQTSHSGPIPSNTPPTSQVMQPVSSTQQMSINTPATPTAQLPVTQTPSPMTPMSPASIQPQMSLNYQQPTASLPSKVRGVTLASPPSRLPSQVRGVTMANTKPQWHPTPTSNAIAKPSSLMPISSSQSTPKGRAKATMRQTRSMSGRIVKPPEVLNYQELGGIAESDMDPANDHDKTLRWSFPVTGINRNHLSNLICAYHGSFGSVVCEDDTHISRDCWVHLAKLDELAPKHFDFVFKAASKKDPDTLSYDEAMNDAEYQVEWMAAAAKEIKQLEEKGCWVECQKSEAHNKGQQIIPCTWVFRIKRSPDGEILKRKGRICVRGDLMTVDAESYAPVVAWSTIRFFLCLAMKLNWKTVSVDWANAFIQAPLKEPMYMQTPRGFTNKFGSYGCLKLTQSIYGSKFAPRNWYMHLRESLLKLGMQESPFDKCLLYRKNLMMVLYVDDAGIAAPNRSIIDDFVAELKHLGFDLEIEGSFSSYLGISIEELDNGERNMTQKGLIKKVIATTKMEKCNPNWLPAAASALGSDPDGEPYDQVQFNYASVVGMLLYLSNNTRPDITFAVSQVARFTANPKKSHAQAIKTIVRYLVRTFDKGILVTPDKTYNMKCWVDADFAGLFNREPSENPNAARSRYGYVITFGGVPLIWKSQLIKEICLSTIHAEYVGLSSALRTIIPIRSMIVEMLDFLNLPSEVKPEVHCSVFEDNQSAYLLATNQKLSVRTKYFCVKHHFFWSHVFHEERNPDGYLVIFQCDTTLQNADYLTKGLVRALYDPNRKRLQGW